MSPARHAALAAALAATAACQSYPYSKKGPDELFADAGTDIAEGRGSEALKKLEYLGGKFPEFPDKEGVEFRTAEAKRVKGNLWRSFVEFREFFSRYPVTSRFRSLEDNVYAIGTQLIQSRASFLGTGLFRDADDGVAVLEFFVDNFPSSSRADEALRQIAEYRYELGDYPGAIRAYERILNAYLASAWRDQAEYRIALCHLKGVRRADLDQTEMLKARELLTNYLQTRAEGARRDEVKAALRECDEKLAESEYRIGEYYRVIGQRFGAELHYKLAITNYPGTAFAREAERRIDALPAPAVKP